MIEEAPGCTIDEDLKAFLDGRGLRIVEKATVERLCADANDLRAKTKQLEKENRELRAALRAIASENARP